MELTVHTPPRQPQTFIGVGFHAFFPVQARHATPAVERLLADRWHELNPSFARVTHKWNWDVDFAARQIAMMKAAGTQVYLTTWDPQAVDTPDAGDAYAEKVAALLHDLVLTRNLDNIRWYCMSNELSLPKKWGAMYDDLPRFEDYHRRIFKALRRRGLPIGLLATDASPTDRWDSIRWAFDHMDDVTAAYGGHDYINDFTPEDKNYYAWFVSQVRSVASLAHSKSKPFIIGEFGPKQFQGSRYGFEKWDGCAYFDTPEEPMAALQTAEAVIAAVNGGADAVAYWTFEDFPDDFVPGKTYANKWGTFRWDDKNFARRPVYYSVGLLTHFFRGPADVYDVSAPADVRVMAIRDKTGAGFRVAVLNRREKPVELNIRIDGLDPAPRWDAWLFNPADAEAYCKEGPLLNVRNHLQLSRTRVIVPPSSLVVLVQQN